MQVLETQRLLLRPLTADDLNDLHSLYSDGQVMKYITGNPRTLEKTKERLIHHIAQHDEYGFGLCAALIKSGNEFVGRCGLEPRREKDGLAGDIAWMFAPTQWGMGLGAEAGMVLLDFGLHELSLHRIYGTADHRNLASIAIMKKLGMKLIREDERGVEYEIRAGSIR